jgi:hypothetical protein
VEFGLHPVEALAAEQEEEAFKFVGQVLLAAGVGEGGQLDSKTCQVAEDLAGL